MRCGRGFASCKVQSKDLTHFISVLQFGKTITMRFYHRIALALLLVYLFGDNALGAPQKGRHMWVKCKPDGKNANCVEQQGPLIELPDPSQHIPPPKSFAVAETSENTPETEEMSGEGSGDLNYIDKQPDLSQQWIDDGPEQKAPEEKPSEEEVEGSADIDYSNFVFPEPMEPKLSENDLQQDHIIQ